MKKIILILALAISLPLFSQVSDSTKTTVDTVKVNPLQEKLDQSESDAKMFRALTLSLLIEDKEPNDLIVDLYKETQVLKGQVVGLNNQIKGFVDELNKAKDEAEVMAILKKYKVRE